MASSSSSRPSGRPSGRPSSSSSDVNTQDLIEQASSFIDEKLFGPIWEQSATPSDHKIISSITDSSTFQRIDAKLRTTKVFCSIAAPFFFLSCLRSFSSANPLMGMVYGLLATDCARMSWNCYIKNYVALALTKLGADGDLGKIGATIMQWASASFGGKNKAENPFTVLQQHVMWDVVMTDCISVRLYKAGREMVKDGRR